MNALRQSLARPDPLLRLDQQGGRRRPRCWAVLAATLVGLARIASAAAGPLEAPAPGSVTLLLFADLGTGRPVQNEVAQAMSKTCQRLACDAGLVPGDLVYVDGRLRGVEDPRITRLLREPYLGLLSRPGFQLHAVAGNHDTEAGIGVLHEWMQSQPGWSMPSLDYAAQGLPDWVRVYGLFTHALYQKEGVSQAMRESVGSGSLALDPADIRFESQLGRARAHLCDGPADGWRIAFGHHPVTSLEKGHSGQLARTLQPLLDECAVDLYVAGHAHQQSYFEAPGLRQIISGAAGAPRTAFIWPWETRPEVYLEGPGFAVLRLHRDRFELGFFDGEGNLVEFIRRSGPRRRGP